MDFIKHYKIKKNKRDQTWIVTRYQYKDDPFEFKVQAKRILQFDSALLVQYGKSRYALYLPTTEFPILILENISQYRVFSNSPGHKSCILGLKIKDYWTFLVPESFKYYIHLNDILTGRLKTIPKLFVTDSTLPAYFKKGFEDTWDFIFHANGKDYLISPEKYVQTDSVNAQIDITEFAEITPLPPGSCYKAIKEDTEYFFYYNSILLSECTSIEPFAEEDYPEEFKGHYGYWCKDKSGNILALHIIEYYGSNSYSIESQKPMKSIKFHQRVYRDTFNEKYYDIWQVTYLDGQKHLKLMGNKNQYIDMLIPEETFDF